MASKVYFLRSRQVNSGPIRMKQRVPTKAGAESVWVSSSLSFKWLNSRIESPASPHSTNSQPCVRVSIRRPAAAMKAYSFSRGSACVQTR